MTQPSDPSRLDRLEALAETTLLAIRELSNRQNALSDRQEVLADRQEALADRQEASQAQMDHLQQRCQDIARQQALNAEQIAANTAGLIELRNLLADFLRAQQR